MEMKKYNPEADELNTIICSTHQAIFDLLSEKGRSVYFPKKGIYFRNISPLLINHNLFTIGLKVIKLLRLILLTINK